ncbi:MAG: 2-amino-4-hydroxy-6-hydroxymethyldihydropteridine diphosphokinase [Ferrimicrobium sp.]
MGLGANLGDAWATLTSAVARLPGVRGVSSLYRSVPVGGPPGQPMYLNAVALMHWYWSPFALLDCVSAIESEAGRVRVERDGPRTLDIDLIYISGLSIASSQLVIPHPRAHQRSFVLMPLAELDAEVCRLVAPDYQVGRADPNVVLVGSWTGSIWRGEDTR